MIWNVLFSKELTANLPHQLNRQTIYSLVDELIDSNYDVKCSKVRLNFQNLKFIDPSGVTVLSNLIEYLRKLRVKVEFENYDVARDSIRYLDDSGFFKQYLGKPLITGARVRGSTLPLELVEYQGSYEYMGYRLVPWLASALHVQEAGLATIKVCFQEIFNNIKDHSQVNIGCSFAQHYPNMNQIRIAISDFGIGIPANVIALEPTLNDQQAIAKACEQGYTTQTTVRNRGAGLDVLIKNIVLRNRGTLMIHSRHGIVSCTNNGNQIKLIPRPASGFYPGTLIQIVIDTSRFIPEEPDEDFEWS